MDNSIKDIYTRNKIIEATINLLSSKEYKTLSINEIINESHASKSSFYRYFKSIDNIIEFTANKLNHLFFNNLTNFDQKENFTLKVFEFVIKYKKFYFNLYINNLLNLSLKYTLLYIKDDNDNIETQYNKTIFIYSIYALLDVWFKNNCKESPKELQEIVNKNLKFHSFPFVNNI